MPGTIVKFCRTYGWQNYNWTTYYQPIATYGHLFTWTTFSIAADTDPTAVVVSIQVNKNASVTVSWGARSGAYSGRSKPLNAVGGNALTYRVTGLPRKKPVFINATASYTIPPTATSVAESGCGQSGELSLTTA